MPEDSVRRGQVIREEAKGALRAFLQACSLLIPDEHRTHFQREMAQRRYNRGIKFSFVGPYEKSSQKHYTDAFMRILQATAKTQIPDRKDLGILRDALNVPCAALSYWPTGKPPYSVGSGAESPRSAAEHLLAYINLTHDVGPAHSACQVCGLLMIKQRGGRKYCSEACLKQAWSYESRKENQAKYRREQRRRDQEAKLAARIKRPKGRN
jgi:predicted nucleic acid-binding Zn ribbon protein